MWKPFRCRLFRDHDYVMRRHPAELFLECRRCGRRSSGWLMNESHGRHGGSALRLRIAEPYEAVHAITLKDSVDTWEPTPFSDSSRLRLVLAEPQPAQLSADGPFTSVIGDWLGYSVAPLPRNRTSGETS